MRQMLAASSKGTTIGGSSRPPSRSARRSAARIAVSDSAAISGAAADRDFDSRYRVSRPAAKSSASNTGKRPRCGGVTQAMISGSVIALAAVRAVW